MTISITQGVLCNAEIPPHSGRQNHCRPTDKPAHSNARFRADELDRESLYNVTMRRVRVTIVAVAYEAHLLGFVCVVYPAVASLSALSHIFSAGRGGGRSY